MNVFLQAMITSAITAVGSFLGCYAIMKGKPIAGILLNVAGLTGATYYTMSLI